MKLILELVRWEWTLVTRSHRAMSIRDMTWVVWLMTQAPSQASRLLVVNIL